MSSISRNSNHYPDNNTAMADMLMDTTRESFEERQAEFETKNNSPPKGAGSTRTSYNYVNMIVESILESNERRVLLSDIYKYVQKNYHEMIDKGVDWQNGIRHNLSLNDCFLKDGRNPNGKGYFWTISKKNLPFFEKGDFRRRWSQCRTRRQRSKSNSGKQKEEQGQDMSLNKEPQFIPQNPEAVEYRKYFYPVHPQNRIMNGSGNPQNYPYYTHGWNEYDFQQFRPFGNQYKRFPIPHVPENYPSYHSVDNQYYNQQDLGKTYSSYNPNERMYENNYNCQASNRMPDKLCHSQSQTRAFNSLKMEELSPMGVRNPPHLDFSIDSILHGFR